MRFYDTSALLIESQEKLLEEAFMISSTTLIELENIKTSNNKDFKIKYTARKVLHFLDENPEMWKVSIFTQSKLQPIEEADIPITDDMRILACALAEPGPITFITNDLCQKKNAELFLRNVQSVIFKEEKYYGYKEITLNEEAMANLYCNLDKNLYDLYTNEYLNIYNENGDLVDTMKWTEEGLKPLKYDDCESRMFGKIKPKDVYQRMAIDSMRNNQLTVLRGRSGTGKSMLALGYLFKLLENGKIDKIVMFVNPVATKESCKFGFLPGDLLDKILGSQIGNFLSSKLGGIEAVYELVDSHKLEFIALADARGYDTSGMNCGIYMTESQNTNINMMKLILSRIGEDTKCILDGDDNTQVDMPSYENENNGLRRVCEVYKNENYFGCIELKNCYRSRIAEKSEEM